MQAQHPHLPAGRQGGNPAPRRPHRHKPLRLLQHHVGHTARAELALCAAGATEGEPPTDHPQVRNEAAPIQHAQVRRRLQRLCWHCYQHTHMSSSAPGDALPSAARSLLCPVRPAVSNAS